MIRIINVKFDFHTVLFDGLLHAVSVKFKTGSPIRYISKRDVMSRILFCLLTPTYKSVLGSATRNNIKVYSKIIINTMQYKQISYSTLIADFRNQFS